jgi:hypothetical protein
VAVTEYTGGDGALQLDTLTSVTDPTGALVDDWVREHLAPVVSLLSEEVEDQASVRTFCYTIDEAVEAELVARVAVGLLANRLRLYPRRFAAWYQCFRTDVDLGELEDPLQRYVASLVGTPDDPCVDTHLYGLVAEFLLAEVLRRTDRGLGEAAYIEQHAWSVTDPGGDCLVLYRTDSDHFRLWESKAVTGQTVYPSAVVKDAVSQLDEFAWGYLARWATVAQHFGEFAEFVVLVPDLWADGDDSAGVGVGVSTHIGKPTSNSFKALERIELPAANRQGTVIKSRDFAALCVRVRASIWKGAMWTAP